MPQGLLARIVGSGTIAGMLIVFGGNVHTIHMLPDRFLFKLINLNLTCQAEHEYMNIHPSINVL